MSLTVGIIVADEELSRRIVGIVSRDQSRTVRELEPGPIDWDESLDLVIADRIVSISCPQVVITSAIDDLEALLSGIVAKKRKDLEPIRGLARSLAHELSNQVTLLGFAEFLGERSPDALELVAPILAARERMSVLLHAMKTFARDGGMPGACARYSVAAVLDEALSTMRFEPALNNRQLVRQPDNREARIQANPDELRAAFLHVLHSSIRAGSYGESMRIGVDIKDNQVEVEIEDDGSIEERRRDWGWAPGMSSKDTCGLGFYAVRRIVAELGGSSRLEGTSTSGTRFVFRLPCSREE